MANRRKNTRLQFLLFGFMGKAQMSSVLLQFSWDARSPVFKPRFTMTTVPVLTGRSQCCCRGQGTECCNRRNQEGFSESADMEDSRDGEKLNGRSSECDVTVILGPPWVAPYKSWLFHRNTGILALLSHIQSILYCISLAHRSTHSPLFTWETLFKLFFLLFVYSFNYFFIVCVCM